MNINKKIQKLTPCGVELIIQGRTTKINNIDIKLLIRKRLGGKLQADHWYEDIKEDIKKAMGIIEDICKREIKDEK